MGKDLRFESPHVAISEHYDNFTIEEASKEKPRLYLGLSGSGRECARRLWYDYRKADIEERKPRVERRAETGHIWEDRSVRIMKAMPGVTLLDKIDGEQIEVVLAGGHVKGHFDGIITGVPGMDPGWHIWEHKIMGSGRYDWTDGYVATTQNKRGEKLYSVEGKWFAFRRRGLKWSNPMYYAQIQAYMTCMNVPEFDPPEHMQQYGMMRGALIQAVNTDTDEVHAEEIIWDQRYGTMAVNRDM